jgi:hypothetical protein
MPDFHFDTRGKQGCQMVYFQTKNPDVGKFWSVLQWKMLGIFWPFGLFYILPFRIFIAHLVYFSLLVFCTKKNLATLVASLLLRFSHEADFSARFFFSTHSFIVGNEGNKARPQNDLIDHRVTNLT